MPAESPSHYLAAAVQYVLAVILAGTSVGILLAMIGALLDSFGLSVPFEVYWRIGLTASLVSGILIVRLFDFQARAEHAAAEDDVNPE